MKAMADFVTADNTRTPERSAPSASAVDPLLVAVEAGEAAPDDAEPRVGVALGGGSARGYAHIGALKTLESHNVVPAVVVGTSFGAVVGALYATGRCLEELTAEADALRRRDVFPHVADFGLHRGALFAGARLEAYFDRLLEGRDFSDLVRDFAVVATDVDSGERVLIDSGPLAPALRASSSMPGIFAPVEIGGRRLIDGGIGTPVPLDTLDGFDVDLAIGIGAGMEDVDSGWLRRARAFLVTPLGRRVYEALRSGAGATPLTQLGRALSLTADSWLAEGRRGAGLEVHTRPPIDWFNFHRASEAIHAGQAALEAFMPQIHAAMAQLEPS